MATSTFLHCILFTVCLLLVNLALAQYVDSQLNTQYLRNPDFIYVLKMEYVHKMDIFGLKMMVKSGLEKIFLKFLHAQSPFQTLLFTS